MKRKRHTHSRKAAVSFCVCLALVLPSAAITSFAQGLGDFIPASFFGIETFIGPILPPDGFVASFRSELSGGIDFGNLVSARLVGPLPPATTVLDVRYHDTMDRSPFRYNANGSLRVWRLAARAAYSRLQSESQGGRYARFDFSGLTVGGDLDLVQQPWLTAGVCYDYHLFRPSQLGTITRPGPGDYIQIDFYGEKPSTLGGFVRYVPPDILGFPMHFEARWRWPLTGSKLTSYAQWLVFRPQIYRFDTAIKLGYERQFLNFSGLQERTDPNAPPGNYRLDMEWDFIGIQTTIYF